MQEPKIVRRTGGKLVVELEIDITGKTMLEKEEAIREAVNAVGRLGTKVALKSFDTDGSPLRVGATKFTSKGEHPETYECPYGDISVSRHVYQGSGGGKTFCPLENSAKMILNSTPSYAKIISYKYASGGGLKVSADMEETLGRKVCSAYVKMIGDFVGEVAQTEELAFEYELPALKDVSEIAVGLDGTCMLMIDTGWREAMTGTISFYDSLGRRLHTIYMGAAPEYGKENFLKRLDAELARVKAEFPACDYVGLADGAATNWTFLEPRTDRLLLDFYHVSEYMAKAGHCLFPGKRNDKNRELWLEDSLHKLKWNNGAAARQAKEFNAFLKTVPAKHKADMEEVCTYFKNHAKKMNYAKETAKDMPIGSGVTEAACKELIKQRLCNSGMRWKGDGAAAVIAIRSLVLTGERWSQFWKRISVSGCPAHRMFSKI